MRTKLVLRFGTARFGTYSLFFHDDIFLLHQLMTILLFLYFHTVGILSHVENSMLNVESGHRDAEIQQGVLLLLLRLRKSNPRNRYYLPATAAALLLLLTDVRCLPFDTNHPADFTLGIHVSMVQTPATRRKMCRHIESVLPHLVINAMPRKRQHDLDSDTFIIQDVFS